MRDHIYKILERPGIYKIAQRVFGPGANRNISREIRTLVQALPAHKDDSELLDVGCGPESWLWKIGLMPDGLDLEQNYVDAYAKNGGRAFLGSADDLPFENSRYHGIWCIGVFHHLPDTVVRQALKEALRVCKKGGYVAILDAVLPRNPVTNPVAYALRKADRGQFMRTEEQLVSLFPEPEKWSKNRFLYAYTGLEMLSMMRVN